MVLIHENFKRLGSKYAQVGKDVKSVELVRMSRVYIPRQRCIPLGFLATSMPNKYLRMPRSLILKWVVRKALRWKMKSSESLATTMSSI